MEIYGVLPTVADHDIQVKKILLIISFLLM